jgi:Flp pilus assembly pilin Flp
MLKNMKKTLLALHKDERGAMSAEYMLLLALIGIPVAILLYIFAKKAMGWFSAADEKLDSNYIPPP